MNVFGQPARAPSAALGDGVPAAQRRGGRPADLVFPPDYGEDEEIDDGKHDQA